MRGIICFTSAALATLLIVGLCTSAIAQSTTLNWDVQITTSANDGTYIPRGVDVDQTNGDIYVAVDCTWGAQPPTNPNPHSQVIWLSKGGYQVPPTELGRFGPIISDSQGNQISDLDQDLWGVAVDPKTGYLYLSVDEVSGSKTIGVIHVIDPHGTPAGVWVRSISPVFSSPEGSTVNARCGGCAISRDGMLLAVAGYDAQARGQSGAKLFTRNLRGTPTDWTDDTWDFAANLYSSGGMAGLGDYGGWVSSPRDVCFDGDNCVYVAGDPQTQKYSGTAPYGLIEEFGLYRGRFGVDTDGSNNIVSCYGTDTAAGEPSGKRVWFTNQDGILVHTVLPSAFFSGLSELYSVAYDRLNNRLIAIGSDTSKDYAVVNSYDVTVGTPTVNYLRGRVVDSDGNPVRNIALGFGRWYHNTSWNQFIEGKWTASLPTDAQGNFAVPVGQQPADWYPAVIEIDAEGYLIKRLYNQTINALGDTDLGTIVLRKSSSVDQITWSPLTASVAGSSYMVDRAGTDDGILTMCATDGGRTIPIVESGVDCFRLGYRSETTCPGNVSFDNYLILDVDDDWWKPGEPVWITVDYLDQSSATEYDPVGIDADLSAVNPAFASLDIGRINKVPTYSGTWKTFTFKADKATFAGMATDAAGMQYGDIRINAYRVRSGTTWLATSRREWIRGVTVSKVAPTTPEPGEYDTIQAAKAAGSGAVVLTDKVMTAQWNGTTMYLEEPDKSSGIRVNLLEPWAANWRVGRSCKVYGTLTVDAATGEPYISATGWSGDPSLTPAVAPLGVIGRSAGNSGVGAFLTGLKVQVWGTVTSVDSGLGVMTVNDGSGDGYNVKVVIDSSVAVTTWPTTGDFVSVIGIATLEGTSPETATRIVKPWSAANIQILVDAP